MKRGEFLRLTIEGLAPDGSGLAVKEGRKIRIELKLEIRNKIDSEIQQLAQKYGYGSHRYFIEVRKMSIQYWVNLNRKHMFEVYNEKTGEKII